MPMKVAMSILAVGAVGAGLIQIPEVDDVVTKFLEPTFADSSLYTIHTRDGLLVFGLILGTVLGLSGIGIAWRIWVKQPSIAVGARTRFKHAYTLFVNKWYFDELIDAVVVRPAATLGRFADTTIERVFVEGALIGGATSLVRAGSASVRAVQTGLLRYYTALVVLGVAALGLYFLLQT
jgi:NADH-quinone oxidoreductase subunit L